MASNFERDRAKAKEAEHLVANVLSYSTLDYSFEEVGEVREYFYKGDIKVTDLLNNVYFVEVKDDSRIGETGNVLCEGKVYFYDTNRWTKGNMHSKYDYYAIVSKQEECIYILDFKVLKKIWKSGKAYTKNHYDDNGMLKQKTIGTLCSLNHIEKNGGLLYTIKYQEENGEYFPLFVNTTKIN